MPACIVRTLYAFHKPQDFCISWLSKCCSMGCMSVLLCIAWSTPLLSQTSSSLHATSAASQPNSVMSRKSIDKLCLSAGQTLQEQAQLVAHTHVYLLFHGAALALYLFLPRGAAIIEVQHNNCNNCKKQSSVTFTSTTYQRECQSVMSSDHYVDTDWPATTG